MARSILVVVDPLAAGEQPVVERAAWLARRLGTGVELFACDYDGDVDAGHVAAARIPKLATREQVLLRHRERLERIAEPLRAGGLAVTVDVTWDFPLGDAIVRKATARVPWLVAKDTEYNNLLQRTFLSNTDWQVIRHCPAPVLLVKPRTIAERPRIMVAVDPLNENDKPAELDDALFKFGESLAQGTDGELHVVHVITTPMGLDLPREATTLIEHEHDAAMTAFLKTHAVPPANVHRLHGLPRECLPKGATEHAADFVVMGAVARRGLKKIFIGSTAERTLDRMPCDLVILNPARAQAPRDGD